MILSEKVDCRLLNILNVNFGIIVKSLYTESLRYYNIRDRCLKLGEFREEVTALVAMQSRIPVQLIFGLNRSTILSMEYNRSLSVGVRIKSDLSRASRDRLSASKPRFV